MIIDNKYTIPYEVPFGYVDEKCRFTALAFVGLAQELAALHYSFAGLSIPHLQQKGLTWIISKQYFEIYEYPLWLDDLVIQTWAQTPKGLFCFRDFNCMFAKGGKKASLDKAFADRKEAEKALYTGAAGNSGKSAAADSAAGNSDAKPYEADKASPCMRATSCWLIVDSASGRLIKPDANTMGGLTFCDERMENAALNKIALSDEWDIEETFSPSLLDIDVNSHVNNLNYVRWILSFMNADFCRGKLLRSLETNFMSSALYGEKLVCRCKQTGDNGCVHSIIRAADGSDVFRARTEWAPAADLSRDMKIEG